MVERRMDMMDVILSKDVATWFEGVEGIMQALENEGNKASYLSKAGFEDLKRLLSDIHEDFVTLGERVKMLEEERGNRVELNHMNGQ